MIIIIITITIIRRLYQIEDDSRHGRFNWKMKKTICWRSEEVLEGLAW